MYTVKAIVCFTDNESGVVRTPGTDNDTWDVTKERYEYLSGKNDKGIVAVELVGIKKIEEPKPTTKEIHEEEKQDKPKKKTSRKKK